MAFAFLTFGLVKKEIWIGPLRSMYFYGYIIFFVIWPLTHYILSAMMKSSSKHRKQNDTNEIKPTNNGYVPLSKEYHKND